MQQDARFSKPHTAVFPMTIHASTDVIELRNAQSYIVMHEKP